MDLAGTIPSESELRTMAARLGYTLEPNQVADVRTALLRAEPVAAAVRRDLPSRRESDPLGGDVLSREAAQFETQVRLPDRSSLQLPAGSTAVDAVAGALKRLRQSDRDFRCTVTFLDDRALEMAEESDKRIQAGSGRLLEGIPFTVKDVIDVEGVPTTGGSRCENTGPALRSATAIALLEQQGAIPISKDSTTEFACGGPESPLTGVCLNPWDTSRWAGGSSSGTSVAVATRAVTFGIGTDVGGSIRLPSAWCGVTGLKPTTGRVSRTGVVPMSWTAETVGPIAQDARTIAAVMSVLAGHDTEDIRTTERSIFRHHDLDSSSVRIAVPRDDVFQDCDSDVLAGLTRMTDVLKQFGVTFTGASVPSAHLANKIGYQVVFTEAASVHRGEFGSDRWKRYDPATVRRISAGIATPAADYIRAMQFRSRLQAEMMTLFEHADLILMPTVPATAPTLPGVTLSVNGVEFPAYDIQSNFTMMCNLTGLPAVAVPAGLSADGCPVSAMLVAAPFRESVALRVAELFQDQTSFHLQTPPFPARPGNPSN